MFLGGSAEKRRFFVLAPFVNAIRFYYSAGGEHFKRKHYEIIADVVDMLGSAGVPRSFKVPHQLRELSVFSRKLDSRQQGR